MRLSRLAFTAILIFGWAPLTPATATPVVITAPGNYGVIDVTAIDGLMVGSTEYNVTFMQYSSDQTFRNNPIGARIAANAIDAALNASSADALYLTNVSVQLAPTQFVVAYSTNYGIGSIGYSAHDWVDIGYSSSSNTAVFSLVSPDQSADPSGTSVPEPASPALLSATLLGLGIVRRLSRSA